MLFNLRPADLMTVGQPTPSTSASPGGFVLMRKLPRAPWQFLNVLMNGAAPQGDQAQMRMHQALVGGWYEGVGHPSKSLPYRLVCNEDGRAHGLRPCVNCTIRGARTVLVGPVLFVRYAHDGDGWNDDSMLVAAERTAHVEALRLTVGKHCSEGELEVDEQMYDVHLTSVATVKK